jgi:DNA primase catalytic subunit
VEELNVLKLCANKIAKLDKEARRRVVSYLQGIIEKDTMEACDNDKYEHVKCEYELCKAESEG